MAKPSPVALVVHGHFYQPPRENPWTDEVPREPGAAPFHDWNARIHAECYRANAYARIFQSANKIKTLVNNYDRLTFDFGPTLARWLERHDPHTARRIRRGDATQRQRLGQGGGLAQVWAHPITPLLSPRDRRTQIAWGLHDFRLRFGRDAEGIWLPETAVDPPTLDALIDAQVRFTILAPEQIAAVRRPGKDWVSVNTTTLDTGRLYRFTHSDGSGRSIALAIFDGPVSRDLAFGNASRDAGTFLAAVRKAADRSSAKGRPLVLAATDGELYGHHKKFADLTLAYATQVAAAAAGVEVTNLATFLQHQPPTWEARLHPGPDGEGTAWSCSHGVGRWRRHCGCAMDASRGWSQAWRGPLREAFDLLRDRAAGFFAEAGDDLFADPWQARDAYGEIVDVSPEERLRHLQSMGRGQLGHGQSRAAQRALGLMEMQRSLLLMYASCGWFFDDIAGLESIIDLRRAAHAMDVWRSLGGRPPENAFLDILAQAKSNQPSLGTGADVFRRACQARVTPARAVARAAFAALVSGPATLREVPGFDIAIVSKPSVLAKPTLSGLAKVVHRRTGETVQLPFSAQHDGKAGFACKIGDEQLTLADLDPDAARALRMSALPCLAGQATTAAGGQAMLDMADLVNPLCEDETASLARLFAIALIRLVENSQPGTTDGAAWEVALLLIKRTALQPDGEHAHRAQEAVWEHLSFFRASRRLPPKALRALAEQLGFDTATP
jgi:alpha-amylase/alpha-mannosidase (GH57 family)